MIENSRSYPKAEQRYLRKMWQNPEWHSLKCPLTRVDGIFVGIPVRYIKAEVAN